MIFREVESSEDADDLKRAIETSLEDMHYLLLDILELYKENRNLGGVVKTQHAAFDDALKHHTDVLVAKNIEDLTNPRNWLPLLQHMCLNIESLLEMELLSHKHKCIIPVYKRSERIKKVQDKARTVVNSLKKQNIAVWDIGPIEGSDKGKVSYALIAKELCQSTKLNNVDFAVLIVILGNERGSKRIEVTAPLCIYQQDKSKERHSNSNLETISTPLSLHLNKLLIDNDTRHITSLP